MTVTEISGAYLSALKDDRASQNSPSDSAIHLAIAIGGNCNVAFLVPGVRNALAEGQIAATITEIAFNGWIGSCIEGVLRPDIWLIWMSTLGATAGGTRAPRVDTVAIEQACRTTLRRGERIVVIMPEPLDAGADGFNAFALWHRELVSALEHALPPEVIRIDPTIVHREIGNKNWYAERYWAVAKVPCHPDAATLIGRTAGTVIERSLRPRVKAIAVDLDGTMWGGIVGEVGAAGVSLDPNSDGAPYLQLQAFLKDLSERGVPLCVVSKNNYDDATSPFLEREEMILRLDDFVYFLAGWGSKADALQQVARDLGIGIDALCFLDDSPHERSEARALVPALIVPDLPEDSGQRVNALVRSGLFMQPVVGDEDRKRVKSYKARALSGGEAAAAGDFTAYLRSLNMTLRALPIDSTNLPRVTALLHKTNQFNVTTRRHTASQLASFAGNTVNYAFCYALSDRIEDAGIIGVILGCPEGDALRIDTWLMSCRVISRTVELAMFGHLLRWCEGRRIYRLLGEYIPTAKNALVAELFDRLGFERVANQQNTVIYEGREIPQPSHTIRIVDAAEDFVDGTNQGDAQ